ncbi:MAG: ABC transporter ATP-binding protein [Candidatus Marinimicrobia bacterium]|nr:ABC transporter ATP-binding protein [Candidatus Neomarinimicrobiota bacterium]
MIKVSKIKKSFSDTVVLDGVSFDVKEGEAISIIGKSGIGKSVLLKHLNGLMRPDSGSVSIDNRLINRMDFYQIEKIRAQISMVFQFGALFDSMTVGENIALGLKKMTELNGVEIKDRISETLEEVGMEGSEKKYPAELSGGMKKRVGIARAIAVRPKYILYDEPTTGLDPVMTDSINKLISKLHTLENVTSIIVTHDMRTVYEVTDRVLMIHEGKIIFDDLSEKIKKSEDVVVRNFIQGISDKEFYKN